MPTLEPTKYLKSKKNTHYCFAGYPSVKIYQEPTGTKWVQHLLFGDYITILNLEVVNGRVNVLSRNKKGWAKIAELQTERVLEVNFIDIGQGDGCHVVTPNDKHFLIDAGEYDNMNRYLNWRFNLYNKKGTQIPITAIVSHSDKDHYGGFDSIFSNCHIKIETLYHNGVVERPGESHPFGHVTNGYITSVVENHAQMIDIISNPNKRKGKGSLYPKTLYKSLKYSPQVIFSMLSNKCKFLGNYNTNYKINNKPFTIEVLSPLLEEISGKPALKTINNTGKDKNGHSIVLIIKYGEAKILLGGDINEEFGKTLCSHYSTTPHKLQVDVAKACHHGSQHFHYPLLQEINALATVISSGDDESFAHPRPDALGSFGKCGYGDKPLLFSTELARSNKEITRKKLFELNSMLAEITSLQIKIKEQEKNNAPQEDLVKLKTRLLTLNKHVNSNLTRYGMINLRTNGTQMIIAQKLEVDAAYGKWDIHKLEYSSKTNRFELKK